MSQKSTEQVLREALKSLIVWCPPSKAIASLPQMQQAITLAHEALALPDESGEQGMNGRSTEQVLREALQSLIEWFNPYRDRDGLSNAPHLTLRDAREALALPDSGDHETAEKVRAAYRTPPTEESIEELAQDLYNTASEDYGTLAPPWCALSEWNVLHWKRTIRNFFAKHPELTPRRH